MKVNYSLDDLRCFCAVAQYGSFKHAANTLGMPLSTLSRRVSKLEEALSLRLLNRDAHRVQLTLAGQKYYERSAHVFDELEDITFCLHQDTVQAKGGIRISAPINFGRDVLTQYFNAFLKKHPDIHLDLRLSNQNIDLEEEAIDVAFRIGDHSPGHWVGRHLTNIRFVICGALELDVASIKTPADLANYPTVICTPMFSWQLQHRQTGEITTHKPSQTVRLKVDDIGVLTEAIKDGIGIGFIPDYHANPLIESGECKHILPEWHNQPRGCQMLYRDRNNMPLRVRLFIDFMLQPFQDNTESSIVAMQTRYAN
jgi:LysR family transcriptional regulator AphB